MILVTHDMAVVSEMADHITVLYCGKVVERGPTDDVIRRPSHPYTRGLIDSIPNPAHRTARLKQIPGAVPDIRKLPKGCNFQDRCPRVSALCRESEPPLVVTGARAHACHFPLKEGETE
jgi:oligopeptide/dipeptide ABC transporter ATP-binding protein